MPENITAMSGIIHSTFFGKEKEKGPEEPKLTITVSRGYGANGSAIAERLSQRLGINCFGYTMLDQIVKKAKSDKHLMKILDEKFTSVTENWILSLFGKGGVSKDDYIQRLIKAVNAIGQSGGVIIGRGAHLILSHHPHIFRVRVEGSLDYCAQRVAQRESLTIKEGEKRLRKVNKERLGFVKELFKHFHSDHSYYDLTVCSDGLDANQVVDIILFTMKQRGFDVPLPDDAA